MTKYFGLIITEKEELKIDFTSLDRFLNLVSDTSNVKWAKLFERETGDVVADIRMKTPKELSPICDLCAERNCPIWSASTTYCKDFRTD